MSKVNMKFGKSIFLMLFGRIILTNIGKSGEISVYLHMVNQIK